MHMTTKKIIDWIWSEPGLSDFLREIADGEETIYGDVQLASWLCDLLGDQRNGIWWQFATNKNVDIARVDNLRDELSRGKDRSRWLEEMEIPLIRNGLLGTKGNGPIYAHSLVRPFHPNNRYQVINSTEVREIGSTSAIGIWGLAEKDRAVCPESIGERCSCGAAQSKR